MKMPNGKKKKTKSRPTSGAQADLEDSGLEQSDYELSGAEQSDYELSGAEHSDHELSEAEQLDQELSGVEQSDNQLSGAEQSDNQLSGAEQSDNKLSGTEQSDDQLSGAEQSDDQLSGEDHEMSGVELSDDQLSGAEQSDDQLSGAEQSDQSEQSDLEQAGAEHSGTKGFGPTASLQPKHVAEKVKMLQGPATVPGFEELLSSEAIGEGTVMERKREFLSRLAAFTERIYKPDGRVNYCKICKKTYVTDHSFDVHLASVHSKEKKFHCSNCNKDFGLERQLKRHQEYHCQAAYKCHFCLKSFSSTKELDEHKLMTHKKGKIEKCEICGQGFTTKRFLKSHKRIHSSETPFQCTVTGCEKSFQTKMLRERHVDKIHRTKEADFRHKCKGCKKKFQTQFDLMVHRKQHKGDESHPEHIFRKPFLYKCPDCGKEIKYQQLVKPHREIHSQSLKPMMERAPKKVQIKSDNGHICKFCNTNLRSAKELLGHVRFVHSVYKCFHCIQEFNSDQARQVHLRKEHYKTEVKEPRKPKTTWPCKHCDLVFSSSSRHDEHVMTMHKGFRCKKCDIVFPNKYAIVKHRRLMHRKPQDTTGVKIYKCSDCSEVFQTLFLKRKHRKIMHPRLGTQDFYSENGQKTNCQVCGRSCASEWHLGEHMKTHL